MTTLNPTHGCLYTTLVNMTGKAAIFSFLPPHGRNLGISETVTFIGDPAAGICSGDALLDIRNRNKLALAIANGDLGVIHTPCPIAYDAVNHAAYAIGVASGLVTATTGIDYGSHSTANAVGPGESTPHLD